MAISVRVEGAVRVLSVDGELGAAGACEFRDQVRKALDTDARDFVVDLGEATGVDSGGLEALTWLKRECEDRLGLVKLCNLSPTLQKILELTRLDRQLERCELLDDALASFT